MTTTSYSILLTSALLLPTGNLSAQSIDLGSSSGNPLTTSGSHLGVGWALDAGTLSSGFLTQPTANGNLVNWNYGNQFPNNNISQTIIFTLTFDEPVADFSFDVASFGSLAINYGASMIDASNGEQTFSFSAQNDETDLIFNTGDVTAGSLTSLSGFGTTTIAGSAAVFDAQGANSVGNAFRNISFNLDGPVTSIQLQFSSMATGSPQLIGDSISVGNFAFTPVPEASGTLLTGLAGTLGLLRRRRSA